MINTQELPIANRLLAGLPVKDLEQLQANCESVELAPGEVIYRAGELMSHVYFPTGSLISLVTSIDNNNSEVGLVGDEGMTGIPLILGIDITPFTLLVQGKGSAERIQSSTFLRILEHSSKLQEVLKRYLYVAMRQLARTAACTRFHLLEGRLARWLLMTQDRAHSDHFHLTHVFLAYMLGVRRVGITKAASLLQQRKLISYQRGDINILDRAALESVSCSCYQADKEIYDRILS
jgi:CRP-like cAMP-binding protein